MIIEKTLKFEIHPTDAPKLMTWLEAEAWVKSLGDGWRLPTLEELRLMYERREEIGGFTTKRGSDIARWYWSCTEHREIPSYVCGVVFSDGGDDWVHKGGYRLSSRPVRDARPKDVNHSII